MTPVIISGGSGTRLWPVSRDSYPKQFCEFYDHSFLSTSVQRLRHMGSPLILTVESMKALTERLLRAEGLGESQAIYEPMGKNTAPAIALLCHTMNVRGKGDEVVGIFPADHLITDEKEFLKVVELGVGAAEKGEIVTLGIEPRHPSTGYGYIEVSDKDLESDSDGRKAFKVKNFHEKPDKKTASEFLSTGKHLWNAGMFIFKVSSMVEKFKTHQPDMWERIQGIKEDSSNLKYVYANLESISIDYAIMEKLENLACIPCQIGWSDVGSWDEISRLNEECPELKSESAVTVFNEGAHSNFVFSIRPKVVGLVDVDNLLVVDTPDAVLISKKGSSQKVKKLLDQIKQRGLPQAKEHKFEYRPWGGYEVLADGKEFKAKTITIDPGEQLSYQSHDRREEHWVVVKGKGVFTIDDKKLDVSPGSYFHIPLKAKHRMTNTGKIPLVFVEVQTGSYFGEDDIVRYEDSYNRV